MSCGNQFIGGVLMENGPLRCTNCGKKFDSHWVSIHNIPQISDIECPKCGKKEAIEESDFQWGIELHNTLIRAMNINSKIGENAKHVDELKNYTLKDHLKDANSILKEGRKNHQKYLREREKERRRRGCCSCCDCDHIIGAEF
jgi:hypothetical protein